MEIEVREFLDNYPAPVQEIALAVRALVFDLVPEARERVYTGWRIISFSFGGGTDGQFCAVQPNKGAGRVNLHFPAGDGAGRPRPSAGGGRQAHAPHQNHQPG